MKKSLVYTIAAISLGIMTIFIPTLLFSVQTDQPKLGETIFMIPLMKQSERSYMEPISSKGIEAISISFLVASIVFILSGWKRPIETFN